MSMSGRRRSTELSGSADQTVETKPRPPAGRIAYLDGIRALAITGVLTEHWWHQRFPGGSGGYIGVDVFFVLSGYIISTMLWRSRAQTRSLWPTWAAFIRRRAVRLYPALLGSLVGGIVINAVIPDAPLSAAQVSGHALVSAFQLYPLWFTAPRAPFLQAWSLAIEWYFYLLWPIALLHFKRRGIAPRTMAKLIAGSALVLYLVSLPMAADQFYVGPARFAELLVGAAVGMFLISVGPGRSIALGRRRRALFGPLAVGSIALYTMVGPNAFGLGYRLVGLPLAVIATSYLIVAGAGGATDPTVRLLAVRTLAFLGRISYSLYLWHLIITGLIKKNDWGLPVPIMAAFELGITFALVLISYAVLERPFMKPRSDALMPRAA